MARRVVALVLLVLVAWLAPGVGAGEVPLGYGATYTAAELAALDRALHAANMDREDLRFRKDLTDGHACSQTVRDMLGDPLRIAPWMDGMAHRTRSWMSAHGVTTLVSSAFQTSYEIPVERDREAVLAGPAWSWDDAETPSSPEVLLALIRKELDPSGNPDDAVRRIDLFHEHDLEFDLLRLALPPAMAWHDVFASPFDPERTKTLEAQLETRRDAWLHETAAKLSLGSMVDAWQVRFGVDPALLLRLPVSAFPTDEPLVVESPHGRIALGTPGDDVYTGDFTVLIDPGGNDRYEDCRIGAAYGTDHRRVAFFADLGGDDVYDCGDVDITLGAAVLGIAAFFDLGQGDDRYVGGHCSLGAAMGGVASFYDDGGTDTYEGKTFTQGAAGFGIGIFYDDSVQDPPQLTSDEGTKDPVDIGLFDNDRLAAWSNAQAFARCRGVALCVNQRGNEIYEAGGVYLHAPLFADRYQSFSQGFAIGSRGIDYAGGIALLIDHDGNDRYLGDIYNQGVGYWLSLIHI